MSMHDELAQYEEAWNQAEVKDKGDFENLPDGKYQVKIDQVRFERAKTSQRLQLAWVFKVVAPDQHKNRFIFHYRGLDRPESAEWMKQELYNCGIKVVGIKVTDLPNVLPNLLDRVIEVTLKTKKTDKGEFQNCFINKLLDGSGDFKNDDLDLPF